MILPDRAEELLRAFAHDPRPGLLLTGDSLLRERLLRRLAGALRRRGPVITLPLHAGPGLLHGQPDPLAALQGGPLWQRGLLERARDGLLLIPAADLLEPAVAVAAARAERLLAAAADPGQVHPALRERLAAILPLGPAGPDPEARPDSGAPPEPDPEDLVARFERWGVSGHRLEYHALLLARALAATGGAVVDCLERFVLSPRASRAAPPPAGSERPEAAPPEQAARSAGAGHGPAQPPEPPAPVPPTARPTLPARSRARRPLEGRRGPIAPDSHRGRLYRPIAGRRRFSLSLLATLLAAAPWQRHRGGQEGGPLLLRPEDLRWSLRRRRCGRLTILVVDGSGSMAQRSIRLAKGVAIDLLREAYQHRNRVAIVLLRGAAASVALWPTRAVERARSCLRALPTGGGTPLASGLLLAARLAAEHEPSTVTAVLLTDGRANVGLGGDPRADAIRSLDLLRMRTGHLELIDLAPRYGAGRGAAWLAERLGPVPSGSPR